MFKTNTRRLCKLGQWGGKADQLWRDQDAKNDMVVNSLYFPFASYIIPGWALETPAIWEH